MRNTFIPDELLNEYYRKKDEIVQVESLIYDNLTQFFHYLHFSYFYKSKYQIPTSIESLKLNQGEVIEMYKAKNLIHPGICTATKFKIIATCDEANNRTIIHPKDVLYRNKNIIIFQMCEPIEFNLFSLYKKYLKDALAINKTILLKYEALYVLSGEFKC